MRAAKRTATGFTLIELMVVVALMGVILALAAPSMREMIDMRRLRAVNAQLVTDLQFARSEAVARRTLARVVFKNDPTEDHTCYTIFTAPSNVAVERCNCHLGVGAACPVGSQELRTVSIPRSTSVTISIPSSRSGIAFEPSMGSLVTIAVDAYSFPLPAYEIDTALDTPRTLRVALTAAGRPTVCAPALSTMAETACP